MYRKSRAVALFLLSLLTVGSLTFGQAFAAGEDSRFDALKRFSQVLDIVERYYVKETPRPDLVNGALKGMLESLDPHSTMLSKEEFKDMQESTSGEFFGIGIEITMENNQLTVVTPIEDTPADKGGMKSGDIILAVGGKPTLEMTLQEAVSHIRGPKGSEVVLTILHRDSKEPVDLRIKRDAIPLISVKSRELEPGYYWVRLTRFSERTTQELLDALSDAKRKGPIKGIILDLRNNPGGLLDQAVSVSDAFLNKGVIVSMRGRQEETAREFVAKPQDTDIIDTPLVVLVNGGSASASEIVAGALQDLDRAVLIGQRSFGKGLVQTTRPLGYNTMLKLTTAKYYIPSGRCIQAIDYSHSQEGSVRVVPDSLVSEFTTRAGRKVYDGGGIMPDIATEPEYISRFAATLYALGFIEDFGDDYTRRHPGQRIDLRTFSITDADYADFVEFMQDKEVPYESDTRRALKALKKAAEDDRFAELKERFERVEAELKDDTRTNLETYREQVVDAINNDIVLRHGYTAGVIEHALPGDREVTEAVAVLRDSAEYARITREQDTRRK